MLRTAAIVLLAVSPLVARADVGVGLRRVPFQVTLTVDREYPEFAFFVVEPEPKAVRVVSLSPSSPSLLQPGDKFRDPFYGVVFVVPRRELSKLDQGVPPAAWFKDEDGSKYSVGAISVRQFLDVFDDRKRIERTYVIQSTAGDFRLELVSENRGRPRPAMWAWGAGCCGLPLLTVALTGWLMVRQNNRKRHNPSG